MSKIKTSVHELFEAFFRETYCSRPYSRAHSDHYIGNFTIFKLKKLDDLVEANPAILLTSDDDFDRWVGEIIVNEYKKEKPLPKQKLSIEELEFFIIDKIISEPNTYLFCLEKIGEVRSFDLTSNEALITGYARATNSPLVLTRTINDIREKDESYEKIIYYARSTSNALLSPLHWPDNLVDDEYYERNEYTRRILEKKIPLPSTKEKNRINKQRTSQYKKNSFTVVDLQLNDKADFDSKKEYEEFNTVDFRIFASPFTKDETPIHNFQNWMIEHLKIDVQKHYLDYYITYEDSQLLKTLCEYWVKTFIPYYDVSNALAQIMFNYAPNTFTADPPWAEPGKIYKKKPKSTKK